MMKEVRCYGCNKLLGRAGGESYSLEIKCSRCKSVTTKRATSSQNERPEHPEKKECSCGSTSQNQS
ncbi:MAG: Com family DNA-binding transcriptional regulator [Magnetococcales bacterium]|nr:Com family DNA-binding transcriptional regulator [Magnetococcales bacterium]